MSNFQIYYQNDENKIFNLPQVTENPAIINFLISAYQKKPVNDGIRSKRIMKINNQTISVVAWCIRYSDIADISIANVHNGKFVDGIYCYRNNPKKGIKLEYSKTPDSEIQDGVWRLNSDIMDWNKFENKIKNIIL